MSCLGIGETSRHLEFSENTSLEDSANAEFYKTIPQRFCNALCGHLHEKWRTGNWNCTQTYYYFECQLNILYLTVLYKCYCIV